MALFADFDGTLVEIAETPGGVVVPRDLLAELMAARRTLADNLVIVSGREVADLDRLLNPLVLPAAGSHGAQRRRADGTTETVREEVADAAARIAARLQPFASADGRLLLELKDGGVALHYRRAPERVDACRLAMRDALEGTDGFKVMEGKMVIEARQQAFDKGGAVRAFMAEPEFAGHVPIFIGDDVTDEDGFRAVQGLGGVGIKIGPGPTIAKGRLPDVASVRRFLRRIAEGSPFLPHNEDQSHA